MSVFVLREGFSCQEIPDDILEFITGVSLKPNENVKAEDLSYLKIRYYDFDHNVCDGEMIVDRKLAKEVLQIFSELFDSGYEIEKIRLVDHYGADDDLSMADNNSSSFNYRTVSGTQTVSAHGFGRAIDINPLYNPYIVGEKIMPPAGEAYADRSRDFAHKIDEDDVCYKIFTARGWRWGGHWQTQKDYQHFYKEHKHPMKALLRHLKKTKA